MAIGFKLAANGAIGVNRVLAGYINHMQQNSTALHMAQKPVANANAFMGAFDQAGNIGQNKTVITGRDNAKLGVQGGERVIGNTLKNLRFQMF